MKKILHQPEIYFYEAEDGRKFQKPEDCERYEYLGNRWLNKRFSTIDTDDSHVYCYHINTYEDLLEIKDFEKWYNYNYPSVHPQESYYQIPGWVYVPYSPSGYDYPECIEPLSHLEDCIKDVEDTLVRMKKDIAEIKSKEIIS